MNNPRVRWGLVLALGALLCSFTVYGQQITGSISGVVMDTSGAAIPAASITMTNEASGDIRRTETNQEGFFNISGVMPGSYTVRVEATGFNIYEAQQIQFTAGDRRTLGQITLDVAATAEEVTVSAVVSELTPVESGEKSVVLTSKQFENVAVVGRSAAEYLKILPGISPVSSGLENRPGFNGENIGINGNGDGGKQSMLGNVSANGTRNDALDITADGAAVSDPGCNCATPVNPNPEMISEFKVQQGNFSAEYAKGPVVVNSITKSGGRDFHGAAYLYARHHSLNSNDALFNANSQTKPENKYYFPGGNIGGPVLLPGSDFNKNRDKMFFFVGYEYFKQTIDTGLLRSVVPTSDMRAGNFSDTSYLNSLCPASSNLCQPIDSSYPGGIIPSSELDPGMAALMKNVPLDNRTPGPDGFNWVDALVIDQNMHQFSTRVDYAFSDYTKLFIRYNLQTELQQFPIQLWWRVGGAVPMPSPIDGDNRSDSISINFTKVINPTLTNETVFGYTFVDFPNSYADPDIMERSAQGYPYGSIFDEDSKIPGFLSWAGPSAAMWLPGGMDPVLFATKHLVTLTNNTTKVTGTHTIKFGGYWGYIINKQPGNDPSMGLLLFGPWGGESTGNVLADMSRGYLNNYDEFTLAINRNMGWNEWAGFVQDSWKIKPNFTLELGLRLQHLQPWTARNRHGIATWVESDYQANSDAPSSELPGVLWHDRDSTVPKSGWATRGLYWAPRLGFAWDLFGTGNTVVRGGIGAFVYHDDQLSADAMDLPAGKRSTNLGGGLFMNTIDGIDPSGNLPFNGNTVDFTDDRQPTTYNWNLTISQRLARRILWEVSYVGNQSWRLVQKSNLRNINQVPLGAMLNDPGGDQNNYRPRSQYSNLNRLTHNAYSKYHSLQTTLTKQTGLANFTFAYTWSKVMGIPDSCVNCLDRDSNYAVLGTNRPHILAGSYVFNVPDLVDAGGNGFAKGVANGWEISGIVQWNSGANLQFSPGTSTNFGLQAANPDGSGNINSNYVTGTPAVQLQPIITCDPRDGLGNNQYVNGACFAPPIVGQNGNFGTNGSIVLPYMQGPAFFNWDMSVFKNFRITESKNFQFRASFFNWMNHPISSFVNGDPNVRMQFNEAGQLMNNRFGYADSKVGKRIISLGIKFQF